jgi:hypothetical protein
MLVDALGHKPAAETLVHAVGKTLRFGQVEIALRCREHPVEDRRGNAVVGNIEKADSLAGVPKLPCQRREIAAGIQWSEVDDRNFIRPRRAHGLLHLALLRG